MTLKDRGEHILLHFEHCRFNCTNRIGTIRIINFQTHTVTNADTINQNLVTLECVTQFTLASNAFFVINRISTTRNRNLMRNAFNLFFVIISEIIRF